MKKTLLILLLIYGHSAWCGGLQVKATHAESNERVTDWGSGVYISKYKVLTCAHTLEKSEKVFILVKDGWAQCKVLKIDVKADLALLETRVEGEPVEFATIPALSVSGAPAKFPPELMKIRETAATMDGAYVKVSIDIGDSGAPLCADGRLIGIVKKKVLMDDAVFAQIASVTEIENFLK